MGYEITGTSSEALGVVYRRWHFFLFFLSGSRAGVIEWVLYF